LELLLGNEWKKENENCHPPPRSRSRNGVHWFILLLLDRQDIRRGGDALRNPVGIRNRGFPNPTTTRYVGRDIILSMRSGEELILPTEKLVRNACKRFNKDYAITEQALTDLFNQYPRNDNHAHVLLKVVALNTLYSTQILAVQDVAQHIYELRIDSALSKGLPEVVDKIAKCTISSTGRVRFNYSFASKYCSWHRQEAYPIWDSRVEKYLKALSRSYRPKFLGTKPWLWDYYQEYVQMMTDFRMEYKLASFSFKDIDKFLWTYDL
jgi:hypothetical protein